MKTVLLTCLFSIVLIVFFIFIRGKNAPSLPSTTHPPAPYTILDVRTAIEFESGHYPGAIHIPLHELETRYKELPSEGTIVAYCRSGNRSAQAIHLLKKKGISNTFNGINLSSLNVQTFLKNTTP